MKSNFPCGDRNSRKAALSAESRYLPMEGECLAAAWAMEKAKYFLLGCKSFLLATDHKPLLGILSEDRSIEDRENPRLQRLKDSEVQVLHMPRGRQAEQGGGRDLEIPNLPAQGGGRPGPVGLHLL